VPENRPTDTDDEDRGGEAARHRTSEALRRSEERFRLVSLASHCLIWDWDIHTGRQWWNDAYHAFFGTTPGVFEPTFAAWAERVHPDDVERLRREFAALCADGGHFWQSEFRFRRTDGSWAEVSDRGYLIRDPSGKPTRMIGAMEDVSHRHQVEAERIVRAKLESTGVLAAGIAHDFNNLLMSILLHAETPRRGEPGRDELLLALERIRETALAARAVTGRLLSFAGGDVAQRRRLAPAEFIRQGTEHALRGTPILPVLHLPADLWSIEGDEPQLEQVVRNIVINAVEASPRDGRVRVEAANETFTGRQGRLEPGEYVRVSIIDSGVGMDREVLSRVFDPYFTTKQHGAEKGIGLGLTICDAIIRRHRGAIFVDSEPGWGTRFHLFLPRLRLAAPPEDAAPTAATPSESRSGFRRILVMDDEPVIRELLARSLTQAGYLVEVASDGESAVSLLAAAQEKGERFSGALLDLTVKGGMGGREAVKHLHAIDPGLKAIVMSGYAFDNALSDYSRHGFCDALAKPFDLASLRQKLRSNAL
jgi:two-component system, cell cycle sensor histidine kinase and response regulator CckA